MIDNLIKEILINEGGYVDDPVDKGGATNFGITQATLEDYLERKVTKEEVKNLTKETAIKIYSKNYYYKPKINLLPSPIDLVIFDICVNSGPHRAGLILQTSLCLLNYKTSIDGKIGLNTINQTLNALKDNKLSKLLGEIADQRIKFYKGIVERDKSQLRFLKGWISRAEKYRNINQNYLG